MRRTTIVTLSAAPALIFAVIIYSYHTGLLSGKSYSAEGISGSQPIKSKYTYVGIDQCAKKCHRNNELGFQYDIIKKTPHANSYKALGTWKAKIVARGVKVKGNPQESPVCLKCHVTGGGLDASSFAATYRKEDGITCEACHKGPTSGQTVLPGEKKCLECHDNPVHKVPAFDYKERFAKIAHPLAKVVIDTSMYLVKSKNIVSVKTGDSKKHLIGEHYGGGIVFYTCDDGVHGLIAAPDDQGKGIKWYNGVNRFTGSDDDGFRAGAYNTERITSDLISDNQKGTFAARICADYSVKADGIEYNDWYLPSRSELNLMYLQKDIIGGFARGYWSSTEVDSSRAWGKYFSSGRQFSYGGKDYAGYVRAIRAF